MNVEPQRSEEGTGEDLHVRVPAVVARLTGLRHALAEWAKQCGLCPDDCDALILASYEAMANTVEHAYEGQTHGVLELRGMRDVERGQVIVTVTDYGRWKPPPLDPGTRGRGLPLIRGLTPTAAITPSPRGTTVTMCWSLPTGS